MKNLRPLVLSLLVALSAQTAARAAQSVDWTYALDLPDKKARASLWIPPTCHHLRGVIIANQTILENKVLEDPIIRQAATDENLGIILVCPGELGYFDYKTEPQKVDLLNAILDGLAQESGYAELSQAPLLTIGHSGNGIFAWRVAYWNPGRVIGVIGLHCAISGPLPTDPKSSILGVPIMNISGQYESWLSPKISLEQHWRWLRGDMLSLRGRYEDALVSELVDPGGCHFSCNAPMATYMAMFIRKACAARLPEHPPEDPKQPVTLKEVAPESGWLTDIQLLAPSEHPAAPYAKYTGDPSLAFWHLDREIAEATDQYRVEARQKKDQRLTFVQDGQPLPAEWIESLKFQPIEDGMTVKVSATFLKETPAKVKDAGQPLGHGTSPIHYSLIGGWRGGGEQVGPDTFRIIPDHLGPTDNIMILATCETDGTYAYAEQPVQIKYPRENKTGTAQKITFPQIPDQAAGAKELTLHATADSGLPVQYYVIRGPCIVEGNTMKFLPMPPKAKYPVRVTVVAHQWGRTTEPAIQSAADVEMNFQINGPTAGSKP